MHLLPDYPTLAFLWLLPKDARRTRALMLHVSAWRYEHRAFRIYEEPRQFQASVMDFVQTESLVTRRFCSEAMWMIPTTEWYTSPLYCPCCNIVVTAGFVDDSKISPLCSTHVGIGPNELTAWIFVGIFETFAIWDIRRGYLLLRTILATYSVSIKLRRMILGAVPEIVTTA